MNKLKKQHNIDESQDKVKQQNKTTSKRLIVFLLVVVLLFIVLISGSSIFRLVNNKELTEGPYDAVGNAEDEKILRELYNGDGKSDIDGWTKSQKVERGLCGDDGSDSDFDGLTDKEEIEVYKSDPLKVSTAGDLYTDKYKVDHNMDVNEYCEYDGEESISCDEVPFFEFTANSPVDFDLKIKDCTEHISDFKEHETYRKIDYDSVYGLYIISNYTNNTFKIDLSTFYANKGNDIDVKVFIDDGQKSEDITKKNDGDILTVKLAGMPNQNQNILVAICKKESLLDNALEFAKSQFSDDSSDDYENDDAYQSLIVARFPLVYMFFGVRPEVYISDTANEQQIQDTLIMAEQVYHEVYPFSLMEGPLPDEYYRFTTDQCHFVSRDEVRRKTLFNYRIWGPAYICRGLMANCQILHLYSPYEAFASMARAEREEREKESNKFKNSERFCFNNFETEYFPEKIDGFNESGAHGVCAGLAWVVALVHDNDGLYSLNGTYTSKKGETVSYSLDENDEDNQTLKDRYLYDYKRDKFEPIPSYDSIGFWSKKSDIPVMGNVNDMTDDEIEFTKLISCYWREYNDRVGTPEFVKLAYLNNLDQKWLSWETIKKMMQALDKGQVLLWDLNNNDRYGRGHSVNIVSYSAYNDGNNDVVEFLVYDNNDHDKDKVLRCWKKEIHGFDSFEYVYYYDNPQNYISKFLFSDMNEKSLYDKNPISEGDIRHRFRVVDSELNILNVPLKPVE